MDLFLIRHPQPDVAPGLCYGRSDVGLAADPAAEARRLRAHLPAGAPVYSSPLGRCRALAERLAPEPILDGRVAEMHFGDWELRRWEEIDRAELDAWSADLPGFAPPGGESAGQMLRRTLHFVSELQATSHPAAAIVTHGGVLRVLLAHWLGVPPAQWGRLVFDFGSVSKVALAGPAARIEFLNRR